MSLAAPTPETIRATRERALLTQTQAAAIIFRGRRVWAAYEDGTRGLDPVLWAAWLVRAGLEPPDSLLRL